MIVGYWVSHHEAPLQVREKLSLTNEQQQDFLAHVAELGAEAVVLSTCNRTELYVNVVDEPQAKELWQLLLAQRNVTREAVAGVTASATGQAAARHLFRVSSGIESAILGEPQILGQVTASYEQSQELDAIGHTLSLLCRSAIHTAKRVRTETSIAKGAMSFSSVGIRRSEHILGSIANLPVLVIGAGEMGQSVIKALSLRGATNVTLVSRTRSRAERVADEWDIQVADLDALPELLSDARVVFSASSAPHAILTNDLVQGAAAEPTVMVDLALPRDIEPTVERINNVTVYDLETLTAQLEDSLLQRQQAVPEVEQMIAEELGRYWADHQARAVVPTIKDLRSHAEQIRQAEVERIVNRIPEDQAKVFEEFSQRLMNKLLHHPTVALRAQAAKSNGDVYADVARELFGLAETQ